MDEQQQIVDQQVAATLIVNNWVGKALYSGEVTDRELVEAKYYEYLRDQLIQDQEGINLYLES